MKEHTLFEQLEHTLKRFLKDEPKTGKIELLKNEPQFTKHAAIYKKVNEIINHLNSKPEN